METEYHHQLYQNPAKSPLRPKKAPVITRGAYSKVRVGSYGTRFVVDWGGRQRQRRQAKTEKADKDREGKTKTEKANKDREGKKDRQVCSEIFVPRNGRRAVTVQRISWKYGKPALWTVTVPVSVQPC